MMKTIENLKPGDTCYCLRMENEIKEIQVSEIDDTLVIYSTGYSGHSYPGCRGTHYGVEDSDYVYFNLSDALDELRNRMNIIKEEIEKWTTSGKD